MCKQSYFVFCLQLIQSSVAIADAARHILLARYVYTVYINVVTRCPNSLSIHTTYCVIVARETKM